MKYQIVPVEPTEEMLEALRVHLASKGGRYAVKAMHHASPPAPSVEEIKAALIEANKELDFGGHDMDIADEDCVVCKLQKRIKKLLAQFEAMEKDDG